MGVQHGQENVRTAEIVVFTAGNERVEQNRNVEHSHALQASGDRGRKGRVIGMTDDPIRRINHASGVANLLIDTDGAVFPNRDVSLVRLLRRRQWRHRQGSVGPPPRWRISITTLPGDRALALVGVPTPATVAINTLDMTQLRERVAAVGGFPLIIKDKIPGGHGLGVVKAETMDSLVWIGRMIFETTNKTSFRIEEFLPHTEHARLIVLGDQVIDGIVYHGNDYDFAPIARTRRSMLSR